MRTLHRTVHVLIIMLAVVIITLGIAQAADQTENVPINTTGSFGADPAGNANFDRALMMKGGGAQQVVHPKYAKTLQGEVGETPVNNADLTISNTLAAKVADAVGVVRQQAQLFIRVEGIYVGGNGTVTGPGPVPTWTADYNRGAARIILTVNSPSTDDDLVGLGVKWSELTLTLANAGDGDYTVTLNNDQPTKLSIDQPTVSLTKDVPTLVVYMQGLAEATNVNITGTCTQGATVAGAKVDVVKPIKTPYGDPTASADHSADGSEVVYTAAAANPTATVICQAHKIVPDATKLNWTIADAGTKKAEWSVAVAGNKNIGQGYATNAVYTGLPANNNDFGAKQIALVKVGAQGNVTQAIELFYDKDATNHPGGQAGSPNWFHYWRQAVGNPVGLVYSNGGGDNYGEVKAGTGWDYAVALAPKNQITVYDPAAGSDPGDPLNRIHGQRATTGIATFWDTVKHEGKHATQIQLADASVAVAVNTPWENGWSFNKGEVLNNHWSIGPDGKPGRPNVDDDGDGTVDNLIRTSRGEVGEHGPASDDVQVIDQGKGLANQTCITAGTNLVTPKAGDDVINGTTITTGPDGICQSTKQRNDQQVIAMGKGSPNEVCITAGVNLISAPAGDDAVNGNTITTGPNGVCNTAKAGNDVQAIPVNQGQPNTVCITAGNNGQIDSTPAGDDQIVGNTITTGADGICNTAKGGDDVQVIAVNNGQANAVCINAGTNLATTKGGDDVVVGSTITTGPDGICNSTKAGNDVQSIPVNQGKPNVNCVSAGTNLVSTPYLGSDDTVSATGDSIHTGADGICNTPKSGADTQVIEVGKGKANEVCVQAGADGILQTAKAGDDTVVGATITTGPNGICQTAKDNGNGTDDIDLHTFVGVGSWPDAFGVPPAAPWAGGFPLEQQGYDEEPDDDTAFSRQDWGSSGKNHKTIDKYDD